MSDQLTIADLIKVSHGTALEKGWWDKENGMGNQLANFHSEISEAWEEFRNLPFEELHETRYNADGKPEGFVVELADELIRIADTCGRYGFDLEKALREKLAYNKTRPYRHGNKNA